MEDTDRLYKLASKRADEDYPMESEDECKILE